MLMKFQVAMQVYYYNEAKLEECELIPTENPRSTFASVHDKLSAVSASSRHRICETLLLKFRPS